MPTMIGKTLTILSLMPTRTRLLLTVFIGLCLGLCHSLIPQDGTAKAILLLYYFPIVPALLGPACWPLRSYRAAAYVSAIGCICAAAHNLYDFRDLYEYFGFTVWLVECSIFWAFTMSVLTVAVLVRNRLRPVYPPGHCLKCGYDLRASKDRCPECGTEFSNVKTAGRAALVPARRDPPV